MTDEHLEFHADRYVRHGIKDCGVTLTSVTLHRWHSARSN